MPNLLKKSLFLVFFTGLLSGINGCSRQGFVNDNLFKSSIKNDNTDKRPRLEVIKLDNGTIMYRDKEKRNVPPEYNDYKINPSSSNINFGPKEIRFSPKKINPE